MASSSTFKTLSRSQDFALLKQNGRRVRPAPWLVISALQTRDPELCCGWTLSRKVANSVLRNRLKRWCREFFRAQSETWSGWKLNVVFLPQPAPFYRNLSRAELFDKLARACTKLHGRS